MASVQQIVISDMAVWSIRVAAFVFGAIWGSFFNVAIYRWPRDLSVVTPASYCPACNKPIPAYLNLPILGFILLRGRAACCGAKLSPRYVVVEIIGAFLCVAVVERFLIDAGPTTSLVDALVVSLTYFVFVGGLVIITFIDLEFMEIPDEVSLPIAALGLVTAAFRETPGVEAVALGAGGSYLVIQLIFVWSYERLTGRRGMGEGDSKLLMMIGAFIGWQGALFSLMAGALQGIVVVVVSLVLGKRITTTQMPPNDGEPEQNQDSDEVTNDRESARDSFGEPQPRYVGHHKIPFGPFLALSALEYLFFEEQIVNAYLSLF
jgi:leader peptidase (prepilin peptidase)/N-methyltransferase